jgi:hypothetical protein
MTGEKRRLFKIWKKFNMEKDRILYCQAKHNARRAVCQAQSDEQKIFGEMLDTQVEKGTVFRVAKQMVGKNRDVVGAGSVKGMDGKIVTGEDEVKERWKELFRKVIEWDKGGLIPVDKMNGQTEHISCSEVNSAITRSKSGKAAGPPGVMSEMLKASGDVGVQWVTDLCNGIVWERVIPSDWRKSWMVSVYKGKGDALECGSYRGIKLLDHVMKIFE